MKTIERKEPSKITFNGFKFKCNKRNKVLYNIDRNKLEDINECCGSLILIDSADDIRVMLTGYDTTYYEDYVVKCPVCNNYIQITKEFKKSRNSHIVDFIKRI